MVSFSSSPIMTRNINFISTWMCFLNQMRAVQLVSNCDVISHTKLQYHFKRLSFPFFLVIHAKPKIVCKKQYVNLWDLPEKDRQFY